MLKKLKSLFVVDEGGNPDTPQDEIQNQSARPSVPDLEKSSPVQETGKAPDSKFIDILMKAIEENNLEGFDYLEFKSSLQSLAKMNMDDMTRYQSALVMAKTLGATPDKILQSANHYLSILKNESDKFQQAVEAQKVRLNQDQEVGLKSLQTSIAQKEKQIEILTREIESEKQKLSKMQVDIQAGAAKISDTSSRFSQAYTLVKKQIADDIQNITSYAPKA
ncbi:MAG: hypothetical protein IPN29_10135 [Saprospiraceae bacterium]|nr:hypothetical protein [Saprospiraceae bacterium]